VFETSGLDIGPSYGSVDYAGDAKCLTLRVPDVPTQWDVLQCDESWPVICTL